MGMINTSNVAIMDGSPWDSSTNRVEIHTISLEENLNKKLTKIHRARSKANWSNAAETKILDLKMIDHTYTLQGHIIGSPLEPSVGSTADKIQYMLKTMVEAGGVKNMTWITDAGSVAWYNVNFNKSMTRREPSMHKYWVQLNLIEGENR